ncbi:MAG: septum formation inhibitor Maf [Tolumonas sp.]|jgi:septum formation protein|uniref:Maf family protein n=1 Tax=Tolumonas auensis TaxID=43948 RepID=UPI001B6C41B5|nr:Maf family protein [Tolumonas auensis]MBP7980164.1 septum formation inhibitor Maf [Tolumonas sp.]
MSASAALYLASASPRRRELLALLDYPFTVLSVDVEEQQQPDETPADYVQRLARDKSQAGWLACRGQKPVLGADTIVVFEQEVLEKPRDFADAQRILQLLSGNTHTVMTAVALSSEQGCEVVLVNSQVTFRKLTPEEISRYWQTGEPADKAGAYGIQGIGGKFVSHLSGSYSAVVGLPLLETDLLLQKYCRYS